MPFLIFGLVILHIWSLHVPGNNNPTGIDVKKVAMKLCLSSLYGHEGSFSFISFFIIIFCICFFLPDFLGHPDNYIPADPLITPAHIVPEWYLLPFYAILRAIPSKLGGVIFMFASIFVLMALPWLDSSKVRSATFRPIYRKFLGLVVTVILLGYLGAKPPEGIYLILARIATAYYFSFFNFITIIRPIREN